MRVIGIIFNGIISGFLIFLLFLLGYAVVSSDGEIANSILVLFLMGGIIYMLLFWFLSKSMITERPSKLKIIKFLVILILSIFPIILILYYLIWGDKNW